MQDERKNKKKTSRSTASPTIPPMYSSKFQPMRLDRNRDNDLNTSSYDLVLSLGGKKREEFLAIDLFFHKNPEGSDVGGTLPE